jgi:hypothetical protein
MPRAYKAQVGAVFGKLTVIAELPRVMSPCGRARPVVRVRCECGTEYELQSVGLVSGASTRCRTCTVRETLRSVKVGQRFDRLVVQGYVDTTDAQGRVRPMVECLCDCGGRVLLRSGVLRQNRTNNCGCAPRGRWTGVGALSTTVFNRQKRRAEQRGHEFTVTHEDLSSLYESQGRRCALSGLPIGFSLRTNGRNTASLDRIDSSKAYIHGNVQWVHRDVNLMKLDFSIEEFVSMCRRVAAHMGDREQDVMPREKLVRGPRRVP